MSNFGSAVALRKNDEANWLLFQFQQACTSILEKPENRRGPFVITDDDIRMKVTVGPNLPLTLSD